MTHNPDKELARIGRTKDYYLDQVKVEHIKKIVANHYRFDATVYYLKTRRIDVVRTKQVAVYFCTKYTKLTQEFIGERIGGYSHSTIIHCEKVISNRMFTEDSFRGEMEKLGNSIFLSISALIKDNTYTIDMNNIYSIKVGEGKSIIFTGQRFDEVNKFISDNNIKGDVREHTNTGLYLVD